MAAKLRSHVRHNVVGYVALFFALTGVAYAAGPLKAGDPAGGDLTGTYPNPTIAANAVDSGKVGNDSLTGSDIASGAVGTAEFSGTIPAARVSDGSSQSIATGDEIAVPLDAESYDTANLHSTSENTSRLTAPVAGIYRLSAQLAWSENPTGTRHVTLFVNGAITQNEDVRPGAAVLRQDLSTELRLAAGDAVEVFALQTSGTTLSVRANYVTMSWVAPG